MANPTYRLYATLLLNRELNEDEIISPGGYEICTKDGKFYRFDFEDTEGYSDKNNGKMLEIMCKNPDYSYENTAEFTLDVAKNIGFIEDFYLDLEGCYEDLKVLGIQDVKIQYLENDQITDVNIPDFIVKEYCDKNMEKEEELER